MTLALKQIKINLLKQIFFSIFDENQRLNEEAKRDSEPFAHTFYRNVAEVSVKGEGRFDLSVPVF